MSSEYRKLYRSRNDRMISGVCGGLGEFFGIDPTLIQNHICPAGYIRRIRNCYLPGHAAGCPRAAAC